MSAAGFRRWATQLFSGKDNRTPDMARHAWAVANIAIIGTAIASLCRGQPVSLTELATALSIANASAAAAAKIKESTEPDAGSGQP